MAALTFLDRFFKDKCPGLHGHTRGAMLACVDSLMRGAKLKLSALGRGMRGKARTKNKIKRVDRVLGNERLHAQREAIYESMIHAVLQGRPRPLVLVDWSSCEHGNQWVLLRASVAVDGRSLTLYEQAHPIAQYTKPKVHRAFLERLAALLPAGCSPIIVTDAGFKGPWFKQVRAQGWDFIGRLRGGTQVRFDFTENWCDARELYAQATSKPSALGAADCAKQRPYRARLYLVRDSLRAANRAKQDKREHAYDEPWLLVTSLSAEQASAQQVVASYRRRMQIELTFRDLKDDRWSMAFTEARTYSPERREMLLLIAAVGTFALWLIGLVAESLDWQRHFQANTVRDRRVLSVIFLAKEVYRNSNYELFPQLLSAALELLRVSTVQSLDPITISGDR